MKLDVQTIATTVAEYLGNNSYRVWSAQGSYNLGDRVDFDLTGAILRVDLNQLVQQTFYVTDIQELNLTRAEIADEVGTPALVSMKNKFEIEAKDFVVTAFQARPEYEYATAENNGVNVVVSAVRNEEQLRFDYTIEVLLGTFSI